MASIKKEDRSWEAALINHIRSGCSQRKAAALVGVNHDTVIKRKKKYADFSVKMKDARIEPVSGLGHANRKAPGGTDAGAHDEDPVDLCAHSRCERLGIWMTDHRAYCDIHWLQLRSQQDDIHAIPARTNDAVPATG